jgi:hypothetical protein
LYHQGNDDTDGGEYTMKKPGIGEPNLGAMVGVVVGAVGGLVAIAIPLAIMRGDIKALSEARTFGLFGFLTSSTVGWFLGGQMAPRLEGRLGERNAGIVGGILGGLVPVAGFALWGWYLVTPR